MNKKKFILLFLALCILVTNLLLFSGCFLDPEYEEGYFTYKVYKTKEGDLSTKYAVIYGLSESGKQQMYLAVPKNIGGYPVKKIGIDTGGLGYFGYWESENLKKVYITHDVMIMKNVFFRCINLHKVIFAGYYSTLVISLSLPEISQVKGRYFARNLYESRKNAIYDGTYIEDAYYRPADVTYYLNYETSEPIYWADDYDNELISFEPPTPTREGYTFGGWYKEAECINQWNFETDKVAPKQYDDYVCTYQIIQLFAKWI